MAVRFTPNQDKILEALVFLASERPGIDIFHIAKVLFYADKAHLNRYGRPVLGDRYVAMKDGPAPSFALDVVERDDKHVPASILEDATKALQFIPPPLGQTYIRLKAKRPPTLSLFSRTDRRALLEALDTYGDMPFGELWELVHKEPSYVAIYREGLPPIEMGYQLLLDNDNPERDSMLKKLGESSSNVLV